MIAVGRGATAHQRTFKDSRIESAYGTGLAKRERRTSKVTARNGDVSTRFATDALRGNDSSNITYNQDDIANSDFLRLCTLYLQIERERSKERLENKRRQDQLKKVYDEEKDENKKKLSEVTENRN